MNDYDKFIQQKMNEKYEEYSWQHWNVIKKYRKNEFKRWWKTVKDDFPWGIHSVSLCTYAGNLFMIWWNPNKFNYLFSHYLAMYCYRHFDIWWDPDRIYI